MITMPRIPASSSTSSFATSFSTLFAAFFATGFLSSAVNAEEVRIPFNGITLNANVERASANLSDGPVVLMTHGTLAHRGMEIMAGLQGMLKDRGVSSVAINLSLGQNDRPAAMYDCAVPHKHLHTDAVGEIGAWVGWLKQQGATKIALLGHSRGGNQTARYAAGQPDPVIGQVFLVAPQTWQAGYNAKDYQKRYNTPLKPLLAKANSLVKAKKGAQLLGPMGFIYCEKSRASAAAVASYYNEDADMDTPALLARIQRPVTVFAGSEDTTVVDLVDKVKPLAEQGKVTLKVVEGADHFFRDLFGEDVADGVANTLK